MFLMNCDKRVLWFDPDDYLIEVLDNRMLPYALRDNLQSSGSLRTLKEHLSNYDKLRHFFADRVLSLSRQHAKSILQSLDETQKLTEEESYRLSLRCRGLSVSDNFWVKEDNEQIAFAGVNIRNQPLHESVFQVSMKGTPISLQHEMLAADVSTRGMFQKTWVREKDGLYLYKSDMTADHTNTRSEIAVSKMLDHSNVPHVIYTQAEKEGVFCCRCKCLTDDHTSFVEAEYVKAWTKRNGFDFMSYLHTHFEQDFANMALCDYLFANPDRHINNWGFLVDADTNEILSLAPLFDHNQALIAFELHTEQSFDELIYDPVGAPMLQSVLTWLPYADAEFDGLPDDLQKRLNQLYIQAERKNACQEVTSFDR